MTNPHDSIHNSEQGTQDGLTKREYFSAMAMQGLMAVDNKGEIEWEAAVKVAAQYSVAMADALIEELNKQSK